MRGEDGDGKKSVNTNPIKRILSFILQNEVITVKCILKKVTNILNAVQNHNC